MLNSVRQVDSAVDETPAVEEGMLLDFVTGKPVNEKPKELARQDVDRALLQEYRVPADDMELEFALAVDKNFAGSTSLSAPPSHVRRCIWSGLLSVVRDRRWANGSKLRDHNQATEVLNDLKEIVNSSGVCQRGIWSKGLASSSRKGGRRRFTCFDPRSDCPMADKSATYLRRGTEERLRRAAGEAEARAAPHLATDCAVDHQQTKKNPYNQLVFV